MDSNNNVPPWQNEAMFNFYLHEYLIKRGMHNAAEVFMNETHVPKTEPIGMHFLDSMSDSPDGVLHEWWGIFYDTFLSRVQKRQESDPQSFNKVPTMTNTATDDSFSFRIPQVPMNEQRPDQQFQASSNFNNLMAQTAAILSPSRLHNNNHLGNFAEYIDPQQCSNKVPRMTNTTTDSSSFRIPQMPMNEQRPQQFQASSNFNNLPAQTAAILSPSRLHNNNQLENLAEYIDPQQCSNKVPRMTTNTATDSSSFRIPQMPMNEQRPQQFQASSNFNNLLAETAARLTPSRLHNNNQLENLAEFIDPSFLALINENDPSFLGPPVPRNRLDVRQKAKLPLGGPQVTNKYKDLNLVPINGVPLNVGDGNQMLTSLMQMSKKGQQHQVLNAQNQGAILTEARASTPNSQILASPRNSTSCDSQYPEIPKTEPSNKDKEMMDQTVRAKEPQHKQDQQMQSQNLDNSRKKKVVAPLGSGECVPDHVDAADGKPADENVDSYLSIEDGNADHRTMAFSNLKRISGTNRRSGNKGFSLQEVGCLHSSKSKVLASHFSSNGKFLASAGHDKKVFIWNMETFENYATEETHDLLITDVRFRPGSTIFATSSFDRSIRLWDTTRANKSLFKLSGHSEQVMSLDFHPRKADLLCSCDGNDIIRLWNVNQRSCKHVTKGGSKQVRFQPLSGKLLATATGNNLKVIDVEADKVVCDLKGHDKDVVSICWDINGKYIASVSEDSARVWSDGKCINELLSNGNKFQSCIFHPAYSNLLVIGGYQSLEFWSPAEGSGTISISAHEGLIAGLADSPKNEFIASASHDCLVKVWR